MSEVETPAGQPAGAPSTVQNPPAAQPNQAPAQAQQPAADEPGIVRISSDKFKERLDETRTKAAREATAARDAEIAKELGMTVAEAKALAAAHKAAEDAKRSEVERLTSERDLLKVKAAELDKYKGAVAIQAQAELSFLTEEQRAAVLKHAGDDPADQVALIASLRPTWQSAAEARTSAEKAAAEAARIKAEADAKAAADAAELAARKAPLAAPANTSAAIAAPAGTATSETNLLAQYENERNPFRKSALYLKHQVAIEAAKKARVTA